jgi:hypothetical protein
MGGEVATSESDAGTTCDDEGIPVAEPDAPDVETDAPDASKGCQEEEGTGEEGDPDPGEDGEPSPAEEDGSGAVDTSDREEVGDEGQGEEVEPDAVDPIREAACNEAAGVTPDPEETEDTMDPAVEKPHGLENAISHVLENCTYNPKAPGLLVAIRHLVANAAKREMHEEARADARPEKKQPSQRRGPLASNGASGTGGSRGNAGPSGQPSTHGNGNAYGHGDGSGSAASSHGNPHGG